jgi:hypothetical protein
VYQEGVNETAWSSIDFIMAAWVSSDPFDTRVNRLRSGVGPLNSVKLLAGQSGPQSGDRLRGQKGPNWIAG